MGVAFGVHTLEQKQGKGSVGYNMPIAPLSPQASPPTNGQSLTVKV